MYVDSIPLSPAHDKYAKAVLRLNALRKQHPNVSMWIESPNSEPSGTTKYFIDKNKLSLYSEHDSLVNTLSLRLEDAERAIQFQATTISDFYTVDIPKMQTAIHNNDSLNAKKIEVLKNRIDNLSTFIRDSIAFISEQPRYNHYLGDVFYGNSFVDNNDGSYTYDARMSYQYLVIELNTHLTVGSNYSITFDVESLNDDKTPVMGLWAYAKDDIDFDGSFTSDSSYEDGSHLVTLGVHTYDRIRVAFRLKSEGGEFVISNIKIEKQ